ncbi:spore germination protein [Bacillus luteolus]|uniref:Spore germination protein n=1 Tax=Litchfieldia luteola TaxID=682179 RepID=A0ABR9QM11_9BACI|nr:spore germination protein [Cytobacillus luteolus]MBE4909536.1 spore germination protein [Cytobacillus luteolus]MBP1940937.1 spore germination protein KA [Cytobacillus luteolus]
MNWDKWVKSLKPKEEEIKEVPSTKEIELKERNIPTGIEEVKTIFKSIYSIPQNTDVTLREFTIGKVNEKAALVFVKTISNGEDIEERVLLPLLTNESESKEISDIVTIKKITTASTIKDILNEINHGNTVLFIDNTSVAYVFDTTKFESRAVEKTDNENVLRGPKESFNENAETNISLIRKKILNENLMVETTTVSKRSKNDVFLLYVKDLANDKLLSNIKNRLKSLDTDAIQNLGLLEQHIEERKLSLFPTLLYTERPDRAAAFLEDGYFVLLMDSSPACLILPATFWSFYHSPEEHYLRFIYGNFTRILRIAAVFIALFTSAIYVAVTNYHAQMIPPDLLLAIAATREKVPFPVLLEILLMEIAFELIREAGLRVPSPIGPTIGIVGALILGQAAVEANIISPIVIIVVALGGVSSFAVSDISLNYAIRIIRFFFIISSGLFGIYGMTAIFTVGLFYLVSMKSFGIPYLAPMSPRYKSSKDTIFRKLLQNETYRPGYLKPKDIVKKGNE